MNINSSATISGLKAIKQLRDLPGPHKVAVGLSGGVDSSLTAFFLKEAGWEVQGLTLWLMNGKGACCSDGLIDAAGICEQLKVPHHVIDSRSNFQKEIIETVVQGYQEGITPLPCSRCNRSVKFKEMLLWAENKLNIPLIATGHYARVQYSEEGKSDSTATEESLGRYQLLRGLDQKKDQSYFLYDLSQEMLSKVIFPLGELTKEETRKEAIRYNLRTANKPESQDLCLADHYGSMRAFLDNYLPPRQGQIVLADGSIVGEHDGIEHFTIGQRKGLKVSWSEPLHVIRIDESMNQVIVAPRSESGRSSCIVGSINWVSIQSPQKPIEIEVQIRYKSSPIKAELIPIEATKSDINNERPYRCNLIFKDKQFSITPGQAAVFYSKDILLGGGIIQNLP